MRGQGFAGIAAGLLSIAIISSGTAGAQEYRVAVEGGDVALGETPIVTDLRGGLTAGIYQLSEEGGALRSLAQVFDQGEKTYLAFVLPNVEPSRTSHFSLVRRTSEGPETGKGVSLRPVGENVAVDLDQKAWTEYRIDIGHKPIFFPMIGPTGDAYTRAFPMQSIPGERDDHPHQRSCWFTHGSVNGVDFWSENARAGKIKETHRTIVAAGPVLARLATEDDWLRPDGTRVCTDARTVTFYGSPGSRIIDFEFTIRASDGPLTFGDTKEGMFGLRVASSMDVDKKIGGRITNAEGLTDLKAWGKPSPWVDYVGPVNQKTVGIAVLNRPGSFRYPTTWHVRTYGLFAANPFGWHDFGMPSRGDYTVAKGESIDFKYRVILHAGDTEAARLDRAFAAYAKPPVVEVVKK